MIKGNLPIVSTFLSLSSSVLYQRIYYLFLYAQTVLVSFYKNELLQEMKVK